MNKRPNKKKDSKFCWQEIVFIIVLAAVFAVVAFMAQICANKKIAETERGEYVVIQPDSTKCDTTVYVFDDRDYINKKFNKEDEE